MCCLLVVLVKPDHGKRIVATKPRLKSVYDFLGLVITLCAKLRGAMYCNRPAPPWRGSVAGENFWLHLATASVQCLRLSLFHCFVMCICFRWALRDIFHTPMAHYSLFVLRVSLNTSKLTVVILYFSSWRATWKSVVQVWGFNLCFCGLLCHHE